MVSVAGPIQIFYSNIAYDEYERIRVVNNTFEIYLNFARSRL